MVVTAATTSEYSITDSAIYTAENYSNWLCNTSVKYTITDTELVPVEGFYENSITNYVVGADYAGTSAVTSGLIVGQGNYRGTQGYVNVTSTAYDLNVTGNVSSTAYEPLNVTGSINWFSSNNIYVYPAMSKEDEFKCKLKSNLCIIVKSRASPIQLKDQAEKVAIETLREVISEMEFRKYMRYGFVLVKGKSGSTYQIFRNSSHTKVWQNGVLVEEICVRIPDAKIPPTDKIIAFRQIIQTSEDEFKKLGNVYKMKKVA